jgi:ADP-dependent phosphofructokinase/glucokinase
VNLSNEEINSLASNYENEIKQIKDMCYRMSWYMRGGISVDQILNDTDIEDHEIMQRIFKDNIEATKNAKMPLL